MLWTFLRAGVTSVPVSSSKVQRSGRRPHNMSTLGRHSWLVFLCGVILLYCYFFCCFLHTLFCILADVVHRCYAGSKNCHCRQLGQQYVRMSVSCLYICALIRLIVQKLIKHNLFMTLFIILSLNCDILDLLQHVLQAECLSSRPINSIKH